MSKEKQTIVIDGVEYVRKDTQQAQPLDGMPFVLVRTYAAGVYFGYLKEEKKKECELVKARNVWYWSGAASLLQMANDGVKNPDGCKFTQEVGSIKLKGVIAILECTEKAKDNLTSVKIWEI